MTFGDLIKEYRTEYGITMQAFADRCGLSKGYISMLENNRHPQTGKHVTPSIETVGKIAAGMNLTLNEICEKVDGNQTVSLSSPLSEPCCRQEYDYLVSLYAQLDEIDQARIIERMEAYLEADKYKKAGENAAM